MDTNGSHRGVKRRRADTHRPAPPPAQRSMSTSSSSTSSDILVASAHTSSARPQTKRPVNNMAVTATCNGGLFRVKGQGVHALLQWLEHPAYRPVHRLNTDFYRGLGDRWPDEGSRRVSHATSLNDTSTLIDDDDGPNHKGTYSKAYTLNHPEVKWVHRGQGRYLPAPSVSTQEPRASSNFTPASKSSQTPRFSGRSSLRRPSGDVDADEDDRDLTFNSQPSHASKRLSDASYSLRRRQSEAESITPGALRAARLHRRSGPFDNTDGEDDPGDESDFDEDAEEAKTYPKSHVDAHPEFEWRHCGNGFYKKGAKLSAPPSAHSSRRGSNRTHLKEEVEPQQEIRYHGDQIPAEQKENYVHCGNGYWKLKSSFQEALNQSAIDSSEDEPEMTTGKFSKEEMIAYKNQHPDAQFIHRGNGRYVLADDLGSAVRTPVAKVPAEEPGQTFSKAFVQAHPKESFYHAGSGRYRRGSRPTTHRPSDAWKKPQLPSVDASQAPPTGLVDKEFTIKHPYWEFHHRGQGRYAYGPRPETTTSTAASVKGKQANDEDEIEDDVEEEEEEVEEEEEEEEEDDQEEEEDDDDEDDDDDHVGTYTFGAELFDSEYVKAHPNETFHHRGQGRWARGLPPPGSSNKTAVRGPGASQVKVSATPSNQQPVENLPGLDELLIRSEGPDKFPQLDWVYRGGGKWARTPKKKEPIAPKGNRARHSRGKNLAKAQESPVYRRTRYPGVVYSDDEEDDPAVGGGSFQETPNDSRRPSLNGMEFAGPVMERRRRTNFSQQDDFDDLSKLTSKNSSQKSKTATPKPPRLTLEEDRLSDEENFPSLYASSWPQPSKDEPFDAAARLMRTLYKPLNSPDLFVNALTRKDAAVRPKEVLQATTAHVQEILQKIQDEYLELDKITAPHARIARKPVKGGRVPMDPLVWEDKKEADLYDYNFDSRKVGYQDPDAQKIIRDAEGRELRKRRNRNGLDIDPAATTGGEDAALAPRRAVKPVSRFDGIAPAPTRKKRTTTGTLKAASETPDPTSNISTLQPQVLPGGYVVRTSGRWKNHIPKRIRELRGDSLGALPPNGQSSPGVEEGATRSETPGASSDTAAMADSKDGSPGPVRKGRPKGSKNLHKRRDAGIPKGPRKPKVVASIESASSSTQDQPRLMAPGNTPRDERNDPWNRIGSSRIGYPFD